MFIKLVRINERATKDGIDFYLTEVSVNISQILYMSENSRLKRMLNEGKMNLNLHQGADFTDLQLNTKQTIVVVGSPSVIETKMLKSSTKQLLRG